MKLLDDLIERLKDEANGPNTSSNPHVYVRSVDGGLCRVESVRVDSDGDVIIEIGAPWCPHG